MAKKRQRITLDDVAREAGVSPMTVSRVVNNTGRISSSTRKHVQEIVTRLGYRPSRVARSLATHKTFTIGVVVPDITNPFFAAILEGIEDVAWDAGFSILLGNSRENPKREQGILTQLAEFVVDGMIICSSRLPDNALCQFIEQVDNIVMVNRTVPPELACIVRIEPGAHGRLNQTVQHLMNMGYRKLGYLCLQHRAARDLPDFLEVMQISGLNINEDRYRVCAPTWEEGYYAAQQLLADHPDLDAIIGGNDLIALGAMKAATEQGRVIPDNLGIIGGDDTLIGRQVTPPLTTFTVDLYDMGATAARLLFEQIAGKKQCATIDYREEIIVRDSTCPNKGQTEREKYN